MQRTLRRRRSPQPKVPANCYFCKSKTTPDYKETEVLRRYMTERGKILSRNYSGICARHQRQLTASVKRARYLALVPFVARVRK